MTPRLVGQHPDVFTQLEDGSRELTFEGAKMRLVHSQRARKLRRRGVFVQRIGRTSNGRAVFAWFVPGDSPLQLSVPA